MAPSLPGHDPDNPIKPGPTALENPMYDRFRSPRPPTERGWVADSQRLAVQAEQIASMMDSMTKAVFKQRGWNPVGVVTSGPFAGSFAFARPLTEAEATFWDENGAPDPTREVDATFENEIRLHR